MADGGGESVRKESVVPTSKQSGGGVTYTVNRPVVPSRGPSVS